jgi:hypothetical protein
VKLRSIYRGLAALFAVGLAVTQLSVAQAGQPLPTSTTSLTATAPAGSPLCHEDDGFDEVHIDSPDGGARVYFCPYDEILWLCDYAPDHHPVSHYYWSKDAQLHVAEKFPGNGSCEGVDLDIPEEGHINFRACNYEGDTRLSCSVFTGRISAA